VSQERSVRDVSGLYTGVMERAMGIEPTSEAWEASIKRQKRSNWRHFDVFQVSQLDSNWSGRRLSALDDLKP